MKSTDLYGPGGARLAVRFNVSIDLPGAKAIAHKILGIMDTELTDRDWLELDRPTIADIACYPYVALAPEGEVSLAPYRAVRAWIRRVEGLPGYIRMPGLPSREY